MTKIIFIISTLQTFPFGLSAVLFPRTLFFQFGITLDPAGELLAQGYGATLIGFGLVLWGLRNTQDRTVQFWLLTGLAAFNAIEATIQLMGGVAGTAGPIIFGNVGVHAAMIIVCLAALLRGRE